jgi:DNA-binding GntR family transcriptional regulator
MVSTKPVTEPRQKRRTNLSQLAYDRLEELIVTCTLPPGMFLRVQDLHEYTGVGRTPLHQAVSRLASDTLIVVRPRHGLQLAPIDLSRERMLLGLRREMERFVVRLATQQASASQRTQMTDIAGTLRTGDMSIGAFNQLDRTIDRLLVAAAGEAFLEHTMRPLHTIFRRIGWIYHSQVRPDESLSGTLDSHTAILEAVANGRTKEAVAASDRLVAFVESMLDVLSRGIDPALFDCNLHMRAAG